MAVRETSPQERIAFWDKRLSLKEFLQVDVELKSGVKLFDI